jgi:hypothetical protein
MMVAFQLDFDATKEKYDQVCKKLDANHLYNGVAAGGYSHLAFEHEGKVRAYDVWHSEAAMHKFVEGTLGPILKEVGVPMPKVTPLKVLGHRK